jgi:hypothetical protein
MRTCASILLVLTAACSANTFDPSKDDAGGDPNPVGGDGGVVSGDNAVYVSSSKGSASGDGTKAHPFASLDMAIAKAGKLSVNACAETYAEQVHFVNGVNVDGSYDCNGGWTKSTTLHAKIAPTTSPAAFATNISSATRVESVDIFAPDYNDGSQSSIALLASASPALTIANATIHAGTGGTGSDGTGGAATTDSGSAKNGSNAQTAHLCSGVICAYNTGAAGGINACTGAKVTPANGGSGGSGGEYQRSSDNMQWNGVSTDPTSAGSPTTASTQSAMGGSIDGAGQNGNAGAAGTDGVAGAPVGAFSANGSYSAADGTDGTDGQPGQSGGGAGGVYITYVSVGSAAANQYAWSEGGAGGGAGGCGGTAGTSGKGGGASLAIIALSSGFVLDHVTIETSAAGDGGASGRPTDPTFGGYGGNAGQATKVGGNGGMGGRAGVSGNGAGGPSIGIAYRGPKPQQTASIITAGAGGHGVAARSFIDGVLIPASPDGTSSKDYAF